MHYKEQQQQTDDSAANEAAEPATTALKLPAEGSAAAAVLSDMAQALGASSLEVEPAVMDVLTGHVYNCLAQFTPQQLAVLLWGFARKPPSAAAAEVMRKLVEAAEQAVQAEEATAEGTAAAGVLSSKEKSVVAWAAARLHKAGLVAE